MARHKCKECGKQFDLKRYLTKHELRMHKSDRKSEEYEQSVEPLKCSMCDKVFPRLSHLQRHQMTHFNVRNYVCHFCDGKFVQKSHLIRHISRKHADAADVEVHWIACDKCGYLFKTSYEMKAHRRIAHARHRCDRCLEEVEAKNDGLRRHRIKCRNEEKVCNRCEASFSRLADLASHETSCLDKVAFVCAPCESYFRQRVQLDRHIKKLHYSPVKCSMCESISETPIQNARHTRNCLNKIICGYCNVENPNASHVAEFHWRRLKRAVSKKALDKSKTKEESEASNSEIEVEKYSELTEETANDSSSDSDSNSRKQMQHRDVRKEKSTEDRKRAVEEELNLFNFPASRLDFCSSAFTEDDGAPEEYLTFLISPADSDLSFDLRGRLPSQLVELFPELENTSIVLLNSSTRGRMTVRVPVCIPKSIEKEAEMRKWLEDTIILQEE